MKKFVGNALCLCALSLPFSFHAGSGWAGVIAGTGDQPSNTLLGRTDAVGFSVGESGAGHALVVPYYSVQNGQMSVLHLVNTDIANGKVVKLRWRGASNGDSVFSLQVLLSPGDVWTAAVTAGADGVAQLTTADHSCTYPKLTPGQNEAFLVGRVNPLPAERVPEKTREGMVEAVVMADIPSPAAGAQGSALYVTTRQVNGVIACAQDVLGAALLMDTTSESVAAGRGFAAPTGGVAGTWYIIDVPGSTTFSGNATAIRAINSAGKTARGNYLVFPQTDDAVPSPETLTADPVLASAGFASRVKHADGSTAQPTTAPVVVARFHDLPDLSTPYYLPASTVNARAQAGQLTQLLATVNVKNQYAKDPSINAKTDWVVSMPTKRYSVGQDYGSADVSQARVFSVLPTGSGQAQAFHSENSQLAVSGDGVCQRYVLDKRFDREAAAMGPPPVFMGPDDSAHPKVCGVLSVVSFEQTGNSALASSLSRVNVSADGMNGWVQLAGPSTDPVPVIGAAFLKLTNPNAQPGVAANYGLVFRHLLTRP
ncbi:MAG: hypothetical protein JWP29_1224 [Rhodoferax sp.]|nr:hypothetical protein [Rhodoferax sp.]